MLYKELEDYMALRKEIEKLILWYLFTLFLAIPIGYILTYIAKDQTAGFTVTYVIFPISFIVKHLENIIIGIWIYQIAKQSSQKYILWSVFGLVAHLYAAVIYLVLYVYEQKNSTEASNKAVEPIKNSKADS